MNDIGEYHSLQQSGIKEDAWVNACNMILEPQAFDSIGNSIKQSMPLPLIDCLATQGGIHMYRHSGFWSPVETVRDKTWLEGLWAQGQAPWKVWDD